MTTTAFFDTNVLVYTDDTRFPQKQTRAIELVTLHRRAGSLFISLQVLQEYYNTATRKLGVDPVIAQKKVEFLSQEKIVRFTETDVVASIELHSLHQISFWDAMIIHAARIAKVGVRYSEDLGHGTTIAGVRIRNPFLET